MSILTIEAAAPAQALDPQNPYPGLQPFAERDHSYFHGRGEERDELARRVRREVLTVLFGRSGLGKTSLLHAGLFPLLRQEYFLPISIRLDFSPATGSLVSGVKALIREALKEQALEASEIGEDETLWEYFHRAQIWNEKNRLLTPLLVFDQFEEIFTLGRDDDRVKSLLGEVSDLIENRIPAIVRERLERTEEDLPFSYDRQSFHVVFSLREDYLAYLEDLRPQLPSISLNHFRLNRMDGLQAREAILEPGDNLVRPEIAHQILAFIGGRDKQAEAAPLDLDKMEVEPALLSLFCREINEKRIARGLPEITGELVAGERGKILSGFYERCVSDLPLAVRAFIEERLLTASGFRRSEPVEDALSFRGVTEAALTTLVNRRLLRLESRLGTVQVELIHDVLTKVILESRDVRRRRESRRRLQHRVAAAAVIGTVGVLALLAPFIYVRSERLQKMEKDHRHHAEAVLTFMVSKLHKSLEDIGRLDLLAETEMKILDYFDHLPKEEQSRESINNRGIAYYNLADVYVQQGHSEEALGLYNRALQVFASLGHTPNASHQIGVTHAHIARALGQHGNLSESLDHLVKAFAILSKLWQQHPRNEQFQATLQSCRADLGEAFLKLGQCEEGLLYLREALQSAEQLAARNPKNLKLQLNLADSYILLGNAERSHGKITEAQAALKKAETVLKGLEPMKPGDLEYKRELASLNLGLGSVFLAEGKAAEASDSYKKALNLQRDVIFASDKSARLAAAAMLNIRIAYAQALLIKGDLQQASSTIDSALDSGGLLIANHPDNSDWQLSLAAARSTAGEIQAAQNRSDLALSFYKKAIDVLNPLTQRNREEVNLKSSLAWNHFLMGNAYRQMRLDREAENEWTRALEILEPIEKRVDDADVHDGYARALIALGQMERAHLVCQELGSKNWNWKNFQNLCRRSESASYGRKTPWVAASKLSYQRSGKWADFSKLARPDRTGSTGPARGEKPTTRGATASTAWVPAGGR